MSDETERSSWVPKGPKIISEYEWNDLPTELLMAMVKRDKNDGELVHWDPAAAAKPSREALQQFLEKYQTLLLDSGFKRVYFNGKEHFVENGELVHPKVEAERAEPLPNYRSTEQAITDLSAALTQLKFKDNTLHFSVTSKEEIQTYYQAEDTKTEFLIISVQHPTLGLNSIHRLKAAVYSDGDNRGGASYRYLFKDAEVVAKVKELLASDPAYALQEM